jgi:hypothetical protein
MPPLQHVHFGRWQVAPVGFGTCHDKHRVVFAPALPLTFP